VDVADDTGNPEPVTLALLNDTILIVPSPIRVVRRRARGARRPRATRRTMSERLPAAGLDEVTSPLTPIVR
jgi:hypothetical protein